MSSLAIPFLCSFMSGCPRLPYSKVLPGPLIWRPLISWCPLIGVAASTGWWVGMWDHKDMVDVAIALSLGYRWLYGPLGAGLLRHGMVIDSGCAMPFVLLRICYFGVSVFCSKKETMSADGLNWRPRHGMDRSLFFKRCWSGQLGQPAWPMLAKARHTRCEDRIRTDITHTIFVFFE